MDYDKLKTMIDEYSDEPEYSDIIKKYEILHDINSKLCKIDEPLYSKYTIDAYLLMNLFNELNDIVTYYNYYINITEVLNDVNHLKLLDNCVFDKIEHKTLQIEYLKSLILYKTISPNISLMIVDKKYRELLKTLNDFITLKEFTSNDVNNIINYITKLSNYEFNDNILYEHNISLFFYTISIKYMAMNNITINMTDPNEIFNFCNILWVKYLNTLNLQTTEVDKQEDDLDDI